MGGSGRYPGTSIESSMWSGRYQVLQKYPEPDPEPGYLGSGRHRVAKPGGSQSIGLCLCVVCAHKCE